MSLELLLKDRLLNECDKLIDRYHSYHNNLHLEWLRNRSRIDSAPPKEVKVPEYWELDPKFNPFYVRRNAAAIAKSIARKINAHTLGKRGAVEPDHDHLRDLTPESFVCP